LANLPEHITNYYAATQKYRQNHYKAAIALLRPILRSQTMSAELRYAAYSLTITSLRLLGDFTSAAEIGKKSLAELENFRNILPNEHCNLTLIVASVYSLNGAHHLASELLSDVEKVALNSSELSAKSLWATADQAGAQGDYERAARFAQRAALGFSKAGDEVRTALMRANFYWLQLVNYGAAVEFGIDDIRITKFALDFSSVDQHRITIALTEALWFAVKEHRSEAMDSLERLGNLRETEQIALTGEVAIEIAAIYVVIDAPEQAEAWLTYFKTQETESSPASSGVATLRLAAEVAEKLGRTDEALRYWRLMADASGLAGNAIFEAAAKLGVGN